MGVKGYLIVVLIALPCASDWGYWAYFHVFIRHLYILFNEMLIQMFCPFLNWNFCLVFWILRVLYILDQAVHYLICDLQNATEFFFFKRRCSRFFYWINISALVICLWLVSGVLKRLFLAVLSCFVIAFGVRTFWALFSAFLKGPPTVSSWTCKFPEDKLLDQRVCVFVILIGVDKFYP